MIQLEQDINDLSRIRHHVATPYHPQTNGLTKMLNKTIADITFMYVDVERNTWDEVLPSVTFNNTAVQETSRVTPFQLVHCRNVTTMFKLMLPHEPRHDISDDAHVNSQWAEEVRQLARLLIQDSAC